MFGCIFASDTLSCISDHIPLWGWIVIIGAPVGALLFYFGPILLPIWRMVPQPIRLFIYAAVAGLLAYLGGRYRGHKNAEQIERERNAQAIQKRTEVDAEVAALDRPEVEKRLRDRWTKP